MNPHADVSDRVEQVIMTALAKDRDKRYQSMAEFWQALEWAGAELGIVLEAIGGPPSGGHPVVATPAGMRIPDRTADRTLEVDEEDTSTSIRRRRKRTAAALFGVAAVAGVTVGLALAARRVDSLGGPDAPRLALAPPDGGRVAVASPPDAGSAVVAVGGGAPDAKAVVVIPVEPDAGPRLVALDPRRPPRPHEREVTAIEPQVPQTPEIGGPDVVGRGPNTDVVVSTRPRGASLYVHGLAAGTDGTTFRRPQGTRMEVRCLFPGNDGWEPTSVTVLFDGQRGQFVCEMEPRTRCVKDLKNPFKKCTD
jgi:hypothetical protein